MEIGAVYIVWAKGSVIPYVDRENIAADLASRTLLWRDIE
jgi:hypothetical protein